MAEEAGEQAGEKTEEPSSHRIEEFRKRGEVSSSKELTSLLVLSACILTLSLSIVYIYETLGNFMEWLYSLNYEEIYQPKKFQSLVENSAVVAGKCVGPILLVSFCVGTLSTIMQVGLLFAPDVLNLKFERINPINGVKRLFSLRSLVEALKGFFKFLFIISIVYLFLKDDIQTYTGFYNIDLISSFLYSKAVLVKLSLSVILGLLFVAGGDFAYQKISYRNKLRQTKEQAKKEAKEKEGNPEIKQRIKTIQREMSQKRMMADIPNADVIVTNPTHISVAIKYDVETMISPVVIAKGADNLALKIRELGKKHDIPLVENIGLARTLYKTVSIGSSVPRSMYRAIAEVLAFVYKIGKRKKALG